MLFKHPHVGDGHAAVNGFAHVVNRQQGDLRCRQGFPRTDPKTVALRPINCWLTCPEFLELVGQDWDKTPEPAQSIYGPSDTRQGKWSCSFRIGYQTQTVRILGQFPIWRDPTVPPPRQSSRSLSALASITVRRRLLRFLGNCV